MYRVLLHSILIFSIQRCIPYRLTKDAEDENEDIQTRIEVLMVSSPNRSDLVFPKVHIFLLI